MAKVEQCNQCKNACPLDKVKCPTGEEFRDFVNKGGDPDEFVSEKKHGHGGHGKGEHGGGRPEGTPDDLYGLLRACGHMLYHGGGSDDICRKLTEDEQTQLKALLKKIVE